MQVAFTAPMKPPDDPVPSGDRTMARRLIEALQRSGHRVTVASRLKTWQREPDPTVLEANRLAGAEEAAAFLAGVREGRVPRPEAWLTYHLYHKAPDLVGPAVTEALRIPYVVVEASRAAKRARDDWARHLEAADRALLAANAVCAVHGADRAGLEGFVPADRLHLLPPFIDTAVFRGTPPRPRRAADGATVRLLTVGMMRAGNKEACYRLLADALTRLGDLDWRLTIVGDGPRRSAIEPLFPAGRTAFLGERPVEAMPALYADHDLFLWPAVDEPYGFVFLEAQASGMPVVGAKVRGVPDIVVDGTTGLLPPPGEPDRFAAAARALITDAPRRHAMGAEAAAYAASRHDIGVGSVRLDGILRDVTARRPADGAAAVPDGAETVREKSEAVPTPP